jgi:signal transduction histidine kinase
MFSAEARPLLHSAAWRISAWAALAYALGTLIVFVSLHLYVASDIERRDDAWLTGEVEVLGDVAERTPKGALYQRVVEEVAELASHEVPNRVAGESAPKDAVFFLETDTQGKLVIWVGPGKSDPFLDQLRPSHAGNDAPFTIQTMGFSLPYRVVRTHIDDGSTIYLGLSDRDQLRVLHMFRLRFALLWGLLVLFGFAIVFATTRRMLGRVLSISEAAARIDQNDLSARVPASLRKDEIGQLAQTLNRMLDRIEAAMHQLHTITGALAHDLRSPLTAVRGNLELSLTAAEGATRQEAIIVCMEELDRLVDFLNTALDVAEAKADALRLNREPIELDQMLRSMAELYEPSMNERGLTLRLECTEPIQITGDLALLHRLFANLLNNEMVHLSTGHAVTMRLWREGQLVRFSMEDNGAGFAADVLERVFEQRVRGAGSKGHGLGLAFVDAVARAHGGTVHAANGRSGGARILFTLPAQSGQGTD